MSQSITRITRRAIFKEFDDFYWAGDLLESDFLSEICDPENDKQQRAIGGAAQHRDRNMDWDPDWVFDSEDIGLLCCSDGFFLKFILRTVHPEVRRDIGEVGAFVDRLNRHLRKDGWELVGESVSGYPVFTSRRIQGDNTLAESEYPMISERTIRALVLLNALVVDRHPFTI